MANDFIDLKCQNCGAKLQVYSDMERFACGYCGSELLVQRRGGTVSLKLVTDAIERVRAGTDRTAAELSLVRLEKELHATARDRDVLIADRKGEDRRITRLGNVIEILIVAGIATLPVGLGLVFLVSACVVFPKWKRKRRAFNAEAETQGYLAEVDARLTSIRAQIESLRRSIVIET